MVPTPFATKSEARKFFREEFVDLIRENQEAPVLANYCYTNIIEKPDGHADWRFSKKGVLETVRLGRAQDRWSDIKSLQCPTLILRGQFSSEISEGELEEILGLTQ